MILPVVLGEALTNSLRWDDRTSNSGTFSDEEIRASDSPIVEALSDWLPCWSKKFYMVSTIFYYTLSSFVLFLRPITKLFSECVITLNLQIILLWSYLKDRKTVATKWRSIILCLFYYSWITKINSSHHA